MRPHPEDVALKWGCFLYGFLALMALLVALVGCARFPIPETKPTDANAKPTVAMREYSSRFEWQRSSYYRTGDELIGLPVFLVIAADRTACIVEPAVWAVWREHKVVACERAWRFARP